MAISNDWNFDFANKVISHIDGYLEYDGGSGTTLMDGYDGYMVYGNTSGAVGKILSGGTGSTFTQGGLTLTNVLGRFANNEGLDFMNELMFDNVANGGFEVGDVLQGATTSATITVRFIEYNIDGVAGHGKIYGYPVTGTFDVNNEQLNIVGGQTNVALVDIATAPPIKADAFLNVLVNGTLKTPGTTNTNNCVIIHYDTGTIAIPEDAHITDASTDAYGYAQQVVGSTIQGSIRVIDSDTTVGNWTNNNILRIVDVIYYDALVAGKVFSVGDIIRGSGSLAQGRVLSVIDDGDSTGKLILAGQLGEWNNNDDIQVKQSDDTYIKYAEVESGTNRFLDAALLNLPSGVRNEQREDQGGIYAPGSLNIIRSANALYSYAQDLYDELGQLDDDPPLEGNVRDQLYTILNNYVIPDLSFRFLEKGSFKDSGNNNIFTNIQTTGAIADIGSHGFFYSSANPTPQPDMYVEQNGEVRRQDWLEGNLDILLKVKTSTEPRYINPTVSALGQLVNSGAFTVHVRPYGRTYDSNEVTQVGGIAVVALGNAKDLNNTTGQYRAAFSSGSGTPFTVGETITTASGKRGLITASDSGATGNFDYILKSTSQLVGTDVVTGSVSGASATVDSVSNLVAGYSSDIRVMVVQRRFTGGTTTGTFVLGETITQTGTGATGFFMEDDSGTIYVEEATGTFNGTGELTGGVSLATNTPTGTAAFSTVPKDIGGGVGDKNYTAVTSADITDANPRTVAAVYEWWKFLLRQEATTFVKAAGGGAGTQGRIFRRLQSTFAEVRGASPFGTKAGSLVIGAQGMFIEKFTLHTDDLRNIQLVDNNGDTFNPPNLQTVKIINLTSGVRGAVYRSTGSGLTTILRNEFAVGAVGGGNNQAANSTILVEASVRSVSPLPNDVPDSGVLRILDPNDTGNYLRFIYSSVNRSTNVFTLQAGVGQDTIGAVTSGADLTQGDNAHVVFIEQQSSGTEVSNTIQYVADIPLVAVARIKGKKPFSTTATFGATGASIGAVLSNDDVVNLP